MIIPAASFGNRMKSLGPKALIDIKDNLSILENQLKYIYRYLHKPEIVLIAGFEAAKIKSVLRNRRNVKVVENEGWEDSNVVKSLRLGVEQATHKNLLTIYGDLVFNAWTLKLPIGPYSLIVSDRYGLMKEEEVGYVVHKNMLENMMYGLPNKWAQIAYFTGKEAEIFKQLL